MDKTTDQLLNLLEAEIDTTDSEPKYCIIDPDSREIYVDPDYQILGVESDEDVERVWFKCPKVVGDNIDLSKYQLRVNYQNANSDKGQYIITDVKIDGDNIIFSWLLGRLVTAYVGKISFIICAVNVSSSDIKNEWNTTLAQAQVLTGLEVEPQDLPTTGDDLINQLKSLTAQTQTFARTAQAASDSAQDNADKVQQQADRVEDILENVPDFNEYDTLAQLEKSFYEGRKYNGMTYAGKTSDKGVKLHSVVGKTVQQTTNGYQLFDASKLATKSQGGATVTNNGDGSFTLTGMGNLSEMFSAYYYVGNADFLKKGLLKLNINGSMSLIFQIIGLSVKGDQSMGNRTFSITNNGTVEITDEILRSTVDVMAVFYGSNGSSITGGTIKPMLYQDGDGTWEPYTGGKPAPNPDYPMEIENVTTSKIFSCSGNMVDLDREWIHKNTSYIKLNDRTIKATVVNKAAYPMIQYFMNNDELEFIKGKSIRILYDKKEDSKLISIFRCYYRTSTGSIYVDDSDGKISVPKDITQFTIQIVVVNTNNQDDIEVGDYAIFTAPRIIVGDTEDTSWRPYGFSVIDTSLTLAEGDTYENGQITRTRKQITFDGSSDEAWTRNPTNEKTYKFNSLLSDSLGNALWLNKSGQVCNRLPVGNTWSELKGNCFSIDNDKYLTVYIDELKNSTLEEFKTWLSTHPLTVEYKLETPTTEELKIPTVPSYFPYTEVSTDNELETDMTWKVLADCDNSLAQEALEKRIEALEMNALGE